MTSRRKSLARKSSGRPASVGSNSKPRPDAKRRTNGSGEAATKRWRRDIRPRIVQAAVSATESLKWSPALLEVLLEELYVEDHLEELLAKAPTKLRARQYPQAVAVALILRHSWRADDLACIVKRLGLRAEGSP